MGPAPGHFKGFGPDAAPTGAVCLASVRARNIGTGAARESMGRDHNPVPGQWYKSLDDEEVFLVLSIDEDSELIELQYEDGDVEEIDYETWQELDLNLTGQPEGWSGSVAKEDEEDDDWDDDEDDDEDDEDDEDDDDYGDRDDY